MPAATAAAAAGAAPGTMRDALATLTRISAELSHALDDGRRRGARSSGPTLAGAHLPVFARASSVPSAPELPPQRRARRSESVRARDALAEERRRRRRDRYRSQREPLPANRDSLLDGDDYVITHDDLVWAAPALAGAASAEREQKARARKAAHGANAPRAAEGFFFPSKLDAAKPCPPPRPQQPHARPNMPARLTARTVQNGAMRPGSLPRTRSGATRPTADARAPAPAAERASVCNRRNAQRGPVRAATLQPGRTSLGARAQAKAPGGGDAGGDRGGVESRWKETGVGGNSSFVPGEEARMVKQQSYCKTGNVPGLRRTRFVRLIGWELVCYTRDLNRRLWSANVQQSFLKVSHAQRKITLFCTASRRPIVFYLASNDMLSSWSRALKRASATTTPKKFTSQKTPKEMERDGIYC